MSVDEMHDNIGVGKLSDRRDLHLCGLMYKRSKDVDYVDARNLPTRQFDKLVLKIPDVVLKKLLIFQYLKDLLYGMVSL